MSTKTEYQLGEILEIETTYGIVTERERILIVGVINPFFMPEVIDLDLNIWRTGNAKTDMQTEVEPWYLYKYLDFDYDILDTPQWALIERVEKAKTKKGETEK